MSNDRFGWKADVPGEAPSGPLGAPFVIQGVEATFDTGHWSFIRLSENQLHQLVGRILIAGAPTM